MEGHMLNNINDNHGMSYEVDETLYFEKGQGISEMVSISLEPDILVQSYNEYVQVRGIILLQGEYRKGNVEDENVASYNNQYIKYIEKVMDLEDGIARFSHRIPVEVSIPTYRVKNINDIMVVVDSFDYELPNEHILKVNSTLHIYGIYESDYTSSTEKETEVKQITKTMNQPEETSEEHKVLSLKDSNNESVSISENKVATKNNPKSDENKESVPELIAKNDEKDELQMAEEDVTAEHKESVLTDLEKNEKEIDIQLNENKFEGEEVDEDKKDVLFLREFFSDDKEETYTKLKIHITQEDDTIESIAKRYEIPATKIMKDNDLTNNQLEEGQLLNIGFHPTE